jgi:hypothetical protein
MLLLERANLKGLPENAIRGAAIVGKIGRRGTFIEAAFYS